MNWITTNIRFPEDLYMELKMEAAKERKSIAAIVREKLTAKKSIKKNSKKKFMDKVRKVAYENAKYIRDQSLSDLLIEMRYEQ